MEKTVKTMLARLRREGFSDAKIAQLVGCTGASVYSWRCYGVMPIEPYRDKLLSLSGRTADELRRALRQASRELDKQVFVP